MNGQRLIDFAYIINLSRNYYDVCEKFWKIPERPKIPFFVSEAVNGLKLSKSAEQIPFEWSIFQNWNIQDESSKWNTNITQGELGCAISHYWVWKGAHNSNIGNILLLEEDFLIQDWPIEDEWNAIPNDWDMIYLGRSLVPGYEDTSINEHVVKVEYSHDMHAYILSQEGLRKILNAPFSTNLIPIEEFMSAVIGVHPRKDILDLFHLEDFNAYSFSRKNFVLQESNSLTSQTKNITNIRDIRDWNLWLSLYLNLDFKSKNYKSIAKHCINRGGVLEFPLFTQEFCHEVIGILQYASSIINDKEELGLNISLHDLFFEHIYHRIIQEHVIPFLEYYWQTSLGNKFACKSNALKYDDDGEALKISQQEESAYCMGLRLTNINLESTREEIISPVEVGNVMIHPTILSENYEGKKMVYDKTLCVVSFF